MWARSLKQCIKILFLNPAWFWATLSAFISYIYVEDKIISFLSFFTIFLCVNLLKKKREEYNKKKEFLNSFSEDEKKAINVFIKSNSCFLDYRVFENESDFLDVGLDSLETRKIVKMEENFNSSTTFCVLNEKVYIYFLQNKSMIHFLVILLCTRYIVQSKKQNKKSRLDKTCFFYFTS